MLSQIFLPIKSCLDEAEEIIASESVSSVKLATDVAKYTASNGGKRIRPGVFLLSAKLLGSRDVRLPYIAAAIELIHTASLLHDDVVDDASVRRGKPAARARWGNQISVLVGDFLWCSATSLILKSESLALLKCVEKAALETTEGELLELISQNDYDLDQKRYLDIIGKKTASFFSACGQCGAIIAGFQDDFGKDLRDYAYNLGMAFQLADDALDYKVGAETSFGKIPGADFKDGKLTLPLITAFKKATTAESDLIKKGLISGRLKDNEFSNIVSVIEKYDGIDATTQLAGEYAKKAKVHLNRFRPSIEKESLIALADYVVGRAWSGQE